MVKFFRRMGATIFFAGYFPIASGTVGSAIACGALWFLHLRYPQFTGPQAALPYWLGACAVVALSILLSSKAKETFGADDPSPVIIDEVAGMIITFFLVPITVPTLITGFLLFRFFDIVKPFPIHLMEELEDGVGITMDDVVGGVCANISLLGIHWGYHFVRGML